MAIPDIIQKVFKDKGFTNFKFSITGSFEPRDYCVQYRETDFNFVSRLMEQHGIFYFFKHENGKHTMMVANSTPPTGLVRTREKRTSTPASACCNRKM